ncbi:MAG TPA: cupin domain-containing protein [Anaerolineales bacterium]|nr:cupin domain-containing protein [Anaerolineales bacterium]
MPGSYTYLTLTDLIPEVPPDSILSRTIFSGDGVKAVLFSFAPGTALSEHTAARPAILHFLAGEADLTLGQDAHPAVPGAWIHMPAGLPHSVEARTAVRMLLLLFE